MKITGIADEARLFYIERRDHLRALEQAIAAGRSKRPQSDLTSRRSRLPAARAIAVALKIIAENADALPAALLAEIEKDEG